MQVRQQRCRLLLAQCKAPVRRHIRRLLLDDVQLGDAAQGLGSHRASTRRMKVEGFAADVGQTRQLDLAALGSGVSGRANRRSAMGWQPPVVTDRDFSGAATCYSV